MVRTPSGSFLARAWRTSGHPWPGPWSASSNNVAWTPRIELTRVVIEQATDDTPLGN